MPVIGPARGTSSVAGEKPKAPAQEVAQVLLTDTATLLRCHPGLKRPWANDDATWDTVDDPDKLSGWLHPGDNLAVLLAQAKGSPLIAVGLDCYKTQGVLDRAKELGITFKGNTWSQRTGRDGYTIFYYYNGPTLKRDTSGCDGALDLLVSGYCLIAPSNTSREPQGGGPYRWLPGHSPLDIPFAELDEPPKALLDWWQSLRAPELPNPLQGTKQGHSPSWLTGAIPEGQRNEILTKRAGYYHRKIADDEAVRDLVHTANRMHCQPPLPGREVETILASILKRQGANHYRGVRPADLKAVE
jgi:hypothetical protein